MARRRQLREWIAARAPERLTEAFAAELAAAFPDASESLRRHTLRECGLPMDALVEGVRQESLEELERTLVALLAEYEAGSDVRRRQVRQIVITAREHAMWAARKHPEKQETERWLLTWLENPPAFPIWVKLRRAVLVNPSGDLPVSF